MREQEIKDTISKVEGFGGMTVNERLFVCGLWNEFDKALANNKEKAKRMLELLEVDSLSIIQILKEDRK